MYISNNLISDKDADEILGYNIKNKNNEINTKKYLNAFDYSLDLIKLREIYKKVYRRSDFSFFDKNGKEFTNHIINVNFNYSNKVYNKFGKDVYVAFEYTLKECEFVDNVCIVDDELIAIKLNQPVENNIGSELLGDYFKFDEELGCYVVNKKNIKVLQTVAKLRNELYENGFYSNGIKYRRFKRSSGSSRIGKCLFINERLYTPFHKWEDCGLNVKIGDKIDLAAYESYISLTSSSIIDILKIKKENILLIDDYDSIFNDNVVSVKVIDGWLEAKDETVEISNSIWDGQSLLDESMFENYKDFGSLLLRNRFFKTCSFKTKIQKFFDDNGITQVDQLNGFTLAEDIKDIKLITTPNSVKYLKFGKDKVEMMKKWLENLDEDFGIVKHEKQTHYFDGKLVQAHYQLLNTLQFTFDEMTEFLQPTIDYLNLLRTDPDVLRYHIKYPKSEISFDENETITKNDIIFKLMGINTKFYETKLYDDFKAKVIKSYVNNSREGHILIKGNYSVLFGNPLEMLKHSIGQFDGANEIKVGTVYSKNFNDGEELIASRSPHVCNGNVWLPVNKHNEEIDKYFGLTNEIVCINSINDNILERLNGADFDSDQILISNEKLLIDIAKRNYHNFKIPTNFVEARKIDRYYTWEHQCDLDIRTSVNKIGEIINLSQELNSWLWHKLNHNETLESINELYLDICKLAVMSCIEIDRAKKEFEVDNAKEINKIKEKYRVYEDGKFVKPKFFKMITLNNGYKLNPNILYKNFDTSMDYLQRAMNKFRNKKTTEEFCKFSDIIDLSEYNYNNRWKEQCDEVVRKIINCKKYKDKIWKTRNDLTNQEKFILCNESELNLMNHINNLVISKNSAIYLLKLFDDKKYSYIRNLLFKIIFNSKHFVFWEALKESNLSVSNVKYDNDGYIKLYGLKFTKNTSKTSAF